jgi:hypothetical protein
MEMEAMQQIWAAKVLCNLKTAFMYRTKRSKTMGKPSGSFFLDLSSFLGHFLDNKTKRQPRDWRTDLDKDGEENALPGLAPKA